MRGKVLTPIELLLFHGITLAYAGKSRGPRKGSRCRQDHPRVCGEKEMLAQAGAIWVGSPPHMRGKGFYDRLISPLARITPAYAGKRLTQSRGAVNPSGSPPHMRGKVRQCLTVQFQMGITPAYAGKSMTVWHRNSWGWDHPRICGEKFRSVRCWRMRRGSPPHMRGKGIVPCIQARFVGITPAYAGKRDWRCSSAERNWDHPRICGEKVE